VSPLAIFPCAYCGKRDRIHVSTIYAECWDCWLAITGGRTRRFGRRWLLRRWFGRNP
jgi:hypothetical protein